MSRQHLVVGVRHALFALLILVTGSCGGNERAVRECADAWNERTPPEASASGSAIVSAWTDKAGDHGCAVALVSQPAGEWTIYSSVPELSSGWDSVRGIEWGVDSPAGHPEEVNATLSAEGRLELTG